MKIGVTHENILIKSIGDTLGLTPIIEKYGKLISVSTPLPELFINNPYVKSVNEEIPDILIYLRV